MSLLAIIMMDGLWISLGLLVVILGAYVHKDWYVAIVALILLKLFHYFAIAKILYSLGV